MLKICRAWNVFLYSLGLFGQIQDLVLQAAEFDQYLNLSLIHSKVSVELKSATLLFVYLATSNYFMAIFWKYLIFQFLL